MWEESIALQQEQERQDDQERTDTEKYDGTKGETIVEKMMGKHFKDFFYTNDEGEDVRELAEKAEAQRDAIREEEIAAKFYWDAKYGVWNYTRN